MATNLNNNPGVSEVLINRFNTTKEAVVLRLFNQWKTAQTVIEREEIFAKISVLDDISFMLITDIRGKE